MKRIALGFIIAVSILISNAYADGPSNNINFFLGQKQLNSDDWEPYEEQGEFGILCDFRGADWPVSIAVEILGSAKEETEGGVDITGSTTELCIGVKKIWEDQGTPIRPFIGMGLASITAEVEAEYLGDTASSDATGLGYYISGGVYFTVGDHLNLGVLARYSYASVSVEDYDDYEYDIDAGGTHVGVFVGYHW